MSELPYPSEPSREAIKSHGSAYDDGVADAFNVESTDENSVAKQGMIEYLATEWTNQGISRNEIARACGTANIPIEQWYNEKAEWGKVVKRIENALDVRFV